MTPLPKAAPRKRIFNNRRTSKVLKDVLTKRERKFCDDLLCGESTREAARKAGLLHSDTATKWMKKPRIIAYLAKAKPRIEEKTIERIADKIVLSIDLADGRLTELLTTPRMTAMELMRRATGKADDNSDKAPIEDPSLLKAIDIAYKRKGAYPQATPTPTSQAILQSVAANTIHIHQERTYEPEWIRQQHGITDPAADAADQRLALPSSRGNIAAPVDAADAGAKSGAQ